MCEREIVRQTDRRQRERGRCRDGWGGGGHTDRKQWERKRGRQRGRDRQKEREREGETDRQKTERDTERQTDREREKNCKIGK